MAAAAAAASCGGARLDTGEPRFPLCTFERSWGRKENKKRKEHNDPNNSDYYTEIDALVYTITHAN